MDYQKLANLLFPGIKKTPEDYETLYPKRNLPQGARVTRLGPSPTGFIHLGNLYGALADERLAHQSEGVCILRIEDTDQKIKDEGSEKKLVDILNWVGIKFNEGPGIIKNQNEDIGDYGPYIQTQRLDVYKKYADKLLKEKKA
ncbi:MAG: glutamate--tRNA ligase, partial [Candidatus Moranbacteria bacterium]|nr:glutamate--tRNA ligase [Candidatus Moranbacteria bacterium]